jgi:hypothetical protein
MSLEFCDADFPDENERAIFLIFSLLWIAFCFIPAEFYRRRNGEPYDDLLIRRIAFAGIGLALLLAWYAMPSK